MATTLNTGAKRRALKGRTRLRSFAAAASCTAALSLIGTLSPVAADAAPQDPATLVKNIDQAIRDGAANVPELAGAISDIQSEIARLDATIGAQREAVNQALVDLQDARTELLQAKRGTKTAKSDLDAAEEAVALAQQKLNELAQSTYRRANTSESISRAAGQDQRKKMLERQSYLKVQTEKQREVVKDLERVRAEKANKESRLRKVEQLAHTREQKAEQSEAQARELLQTASGDISEAISTRETLLEQQKKAEAVLSSVKEATTQPLAADKQQAPVATNDALAAQGPAANPNNAQYAAEVESPVQTEDQAQAQVQEQPEQQATPSESAETAASADTAAAPAAVEEPVAGGSSMSDEDMLKAGAAVFGVAAAVVAASQPDHTALDAGVGSSTTDLKALQGVLTIADAALDTTTGNTAAAATTGAAGTAGADTVADPGTAVGQGIADNNQAASGGLIDDLGAVLEALDTTLTVSEEASEIVADQSGSALVEAVIARAQSQVGVPYAWGGGDANGPTRGIRDGGVADSYGDFNKVGFDCSGLMIYSFAGAGISLPHYTGYQYNHGRHIPISDIKRGDMIFYGANGNQHVALYLGDGTMIEAPQSGGHVQVVPVRYSGISPNAVRLID